MDTKIINLFGQPSAGKSTSAAGLFHLMKLKGINCELVTEYAKQTVWREMGSKAFEDQLYITAKQHSGLRRCVGKVSYIITDSPLLLSLAYIPEGYFSHFKPLVLEIFNSFENINFLIKRTKPYNPIGRNQDQAGADAIAHKVENLLLDNGVKYDSVDGDANAPQKIMDSIFCQKCGSDWLDHEFGVPAPYCPMVTRIRPLIFDPEFYPEDRGI